MVHLIKRLDRTINIFSVADLADRDFVAKIVDEVDDPIVALANPEAVRISSRLLEITWPGTITLRIVRPLIVPGYPSQEIPERPDGTSTHEPKPWPSQPRGEPGRSQ